MRVTNDLCPAPATHSYLGYHIHILAAAPSTGEAHEWIQRMLWHKQNEKVYPITLAGLRSVSVSKVDERLGSLTGEFFGRHALATVHDDRR